MKLFSFLKELHDKAFKDSNWLIYDKKHSPHRDLVSLYGSLIELTDGMVILIEAKAKTGIPSLFRTFLETYVELRNLVEDPKYDYFMEASYYEQWLKVLRESKKGENPYLAGIEKLSNLADLISHTKRKFETLKKRGYSPLTVFEKFKRAGMGSEYRSLYNFLSADTHSNIRALTNRHIVKLGKGDFEIIFYKDTPVEYFRLFIGHTCELLVDASIRIHEHLKSSMVDSWRSLQEKLREIREQEIVP